MRMPGVGPEPPQPTAVAVSHAEHEEAAIRRVGNGFHRDDEPFAERLVLVGEAEGRPNFRRTELQSQLQCASTDSAVRCTFLETKLAD